MTFDFGVKKLDIVILTALGVGGATLVGSLLGFTFRHLSHKMSDYILALAAGVMLASAYSGLILPSIEHGGVICCIIGIFAGAVTINMLDKAVPRLYGISESTDERRVRVLLFVSAIAIHNLPEGIAAGVGFGTGDFSDAMLIAGGIALHNIPEGMVIIAPMLATGMKPSRVFLIAAITGFFEVIGTFIGYFAVNISQAVLPFALAFAGGTMLYVISDEMIPETHADGNHNGSTYALLFGFCLMLLLGALMN